jgi:hypothetical protein
VAADRNPWYLHVLVLALYRAGQPAAAIEHAGQSLKGSWTGQPVNWLLLSLAHHQLGHAAEAQCWMEKATRALPGDVFDESLSCHEWLEAQILLREARAESGPR